MGFASPSAERSPSFLRNPYRRPAGSIILHDMKRLAVLILAASTRLLAQQPPCEPVTVERTTSVSTFRVSNPTKDVLIPARAGARPDTLWLLFDSGAGRTVLDSAAARRLGIESTGEDSIHGVGSGATRTAVVNDGTINLPGVRLRHVKLYVTHISPSSGADRAPDGIIGYDLLCGSVVTLDFEHSSMTVAAPSAFRSPRGADILPLRIRGRWSFVRGTIKVPGRPPVDDDFLVDTGSWDDVNHPVIRESTGPLKSIRTGAGGFGASQPGVIGENEWFRIARTTIDHTRSACCASTPEVSRQLGAGILTRFRLTFDYPHGHLILEPR